jgi:hypothetical protein
MAKAGFLFAGWMPFVVKVLFSYCNGSLFLFAELLFSVSPSFFLNKQFVVITVCVLFLSKTCPFLDDELCLLLSDIEEVHCATNYLNIWPKTKYPFEDNLS